MLTEERKRIGIALSGGGVRAAVFHFGTLARLAEDGLLENVTYISTVSGGSLGMALIFAHSGDSFPSSSEYLDSTVPRLKELLTTSDLGETYKRKVLRTPSLLRRRTAADFARQIEQTWSINMRLSDLPENPIWIINAACHETGKNWRFRKKRIGDPTFGYSVVPEVRISDAIAASSAVPFFIGPLIQDTRDKDWFEYDDDRVTTYPIKPPHDTVHLFDGAIYDNLGIEALLKRKESDVNFLVVSNGSSKIKDSPYRFNLKSYKRLIEIIYRRSVDMYSRYFVDYYLECICREGRYIQFGNSAKYIFCQEEKLSAIDHLSRTLTDDELEVAADISIARFKLSPEHFNLLFLHGYEVANCTLHAHDPAGFELKPEFPDV